VIIKNTENDKCWWVCGKTGATEHCWWECKRGHYMATLQINRNSPTIQQSHFWMSTQIIESRGLNRNLYNHIHSSITQKAKRQKQPVLAFCHCNKIPDPSYL
jgi:phospholipase C